jgi:hypothetical protein
MSKALENTFADAFHSHFCNGACRANELNDTCFCTEAAIIAAAALVKALAEAAASPPLPPCPPPRLVKS